MEQPHPPDDDHPKPGDDHRSTVDTSRPFRSVKEAVAIFGDRILLPEIHTPKPFTFPKKETPFYSPSPIDRDPHNSNYSSPRGSTYSSHHDKLSDTVRKLEVELEDTKAELKQLKERESETEVALASLNAELHKNMSKLALAEAAVAKRATTTVGNAAIREEEKKRDAYLRMDRSGPSPSLAEILSTGEKEGLVVGKKKKKKKERKAVVKKKPIIPLVGELFARKKGASSTALQNPLYASSHLQWN